MTTDDPGRDPRDMDENELYIPDNPGHDQDDAQLRDVHRLAGLVTDESAPIIDAFPRMTPEDRAAALEILDRIAGLTEDPEVTRARQVILLDLARGEDSLREILEHGHPRHRGGKVLLDPQTGKPLRNRNVDRSARAQLRKLEQFRAELTGIPPAAQDELTGTPDDGIMGA